MASAPSLPGVKPPATHLGGFTYTQPEVSVIALGVILLIIGLIVAGLHVLVVLGLILLVVGVVLALLGTTGRAVGGRKHWY